MNIKVVAGSMSSCVGCMFRDTGNSSCYIPSSIGVCSCDELPGYIYVLSTPVPGLTAKLQRYATLPKLCTEARIELRTLRRELKRRVG